MNEEPTGIHELRQEVSQLRRANELRGSRRPPASGTRRTGADRRRTYSVRARRPRHRLGLVGLGLAVLVTIAVISGVFGNSRSFAPPSRSALAGLSMRERVVAIADSQVGYSTNPSNSYCNKFSAYWSAGNTGCPSGELSEEWCADFAAWAWRKAGVPFDYGFGPGDINASAASFYTWAVYHGQWHPAGEGYVPQAGDVAVYGLSLGGVPTAAHVAVVTSGSPSEPGPDVVNGDGDRTGFSVVETGTDQVYADVGHHEHATLAGYASPA